MNKMIYPITEKSLSEQHQRPIQSPVYVSNLAEIGIEQKVFLDYFSPLFQELPWDYYDPRRMQILLLQKCLPHAARAIQTQFRAYFTGDIGQEVLQPWIEQLSDEQRAAFDRIQPWRRRSVARFELSQSNDRIDLLRTPVPQFVQDLEEEDYRSWPRHFIEAPSHHVEQELFYDWLKRIFQLPPLKERGVRKLGITVHFMSVQAKHGKPGDNSPEGAHEDGADFIVSALVINRTNIRGGESQIIEQLDSGQRVSLFKRKLQAGEFIFQADTGEEKIYGNDLWHHVTPFYLRDQAAGEAWRDIIGLDINIIE
ncbi:MAG: 2OG-Fe dioxygenase family protein [Bacteroidota bacterium]